MMHGPGLYSEMKRRLEDCSWGYYKDIMSIVKAGSSVINRRNMR